MIQDISGRLTREFASCLQANMQVTGGAPAVGAGAADATGASSPPPAPDGSNAAQRPAVQAARPVGGIGLALWATWRAIVRFFRRLLGGGG